MVVSFTCLERRPSRTYCSLTILILSAFPPSVRAPPTRIPLMPPSPAACRFAKKKRLTEKNQLERSISRVRRPRLAPRSEGYARCWPRRSLRSCVYEVRSRRARQKEVAAKQKGERIRGWKYVNAVTTCDEDISMALPEPHTIPQRSQNRQSPYSCWYTSR
jgi:hypothetical protein